LIKNKQAIGDALQNGTNMGFVAHRFRVQPGIDQGHPDLPTDGVEHPGFFTAPGARVIVDERDHPVNLALPPDRHVEPGKNAGFGRGAV